MESKIEESAPTKGTLRRIAPIARAQFELRQTGEGYESHAG